MPEYLETITGLWEGKDLDELEDGVLSKLGELAGTYDRYSQAEIQSQLNAAQRIFATRTRILKGFGIIILKANRREYKLPTHFFDFINKRWPMFYRAPSSGGYSRVERKSEQRLDNEFASWRDETGTVPRYCYKGQVFGNTRLIGLSPLPDTDGEEYVAGTDTGIYVTSTNNSIGGNISGIHKTGYANSAFYVDSEGRDLSALGVTVGMTIRNITDDSYGQITAIGSQDATNDKLTVTLANGTDNDFDVGDSIMIFAGEYGVITSWEDTGEQYLFSSELGALAAITVPDGNLFFPYVRLPVKLTNANQYPEIPPLFHEALEWRAAAILLATEHDGRIDTGKAKGYMEMFESEVQLCIEHYADSLEFPEAIEADPEYIGDL